MSTLLDQLNLNDDTVKGILNFLPYPFLVSELRGSKRQNVFVNQKFLDEIGYTCEDIPTNEEWFEMAYPDPIYREEVKEQWTSRAVQAQKLKEDSVFLRALIHTKRKGDRWYEVKSSLSGSFYLVAFIDIHDVLARDEELLNANQNKDKILSILGHDLRGPIRNLHALSSLITKTDLNSKEFIEAVKNINTRAFQALEFLDTTLVWTKSNFDKISINIENISPKILVEKILPMYSDLYEQKKINVVLEIPTAISIYSDVEILTIVIRNLIYNAIKFTPENGTIHINAEWEIGFFTLSVKDSGIGIDKNILDKITGNLSSSSSVGTQKETGFGIGLKLCKELLTQINGALEIESIPNIGTKATIKLKNNPEDY